MLPGIAGRTTTGTGVTGLDSAIREAIDRAEARDPAARERVYRSARQALERGLARHPGLDQATIDEQRRRFDELIREIESEKTAEEDAGGAEPDARLSATEEWTDPFAAELLEPPVAEEPPLAEEADRVAAGSVPKQHEPPAWPEHEELRAEHGISPAPAARGPEQADDPGGRPADMFDRLAAEVRAERRPSKKERKAAGKQERRRARKERRRPGAAARLMSGLFLLASLLVFGALALWFLNATGLVGGTVTAGGGASSFRKFDAVSNGGPSNLMTEDSFGGAWSPIFVPGKGDRIVPGPASRVEKVSDERGKALRLTSTTSGPDGYLRIEVPAAVMDSMAGRTSVLALNMRAVDGKPTEIAIECAFSSLGGCSRRRFHVAAEMTDVVMKLVFEKGTPPHRPGYLLLNTDIAGKGRPVDLFAVGLRGGS